MGGTERNPEEFELLGVHPVIVPEIPPSDKYHPEVGVPVTERIRKEDRDPSVSSDVPDINEVIRRRSGAGVPIDSAVSESESYLAHVGADLDEVKRRIERIVACIGAFGDRSFVGRLFHFTEYRKLQQEYDAAIRKKHQLEELLRIGHVEVSENLMEYKG